MRDRRLTQAARVQDTPKCRVGFPILRGRDLECVKLILQGRLFNTQKVGMDYDANTAVDLLTTQIQQLQASLNQVAAYIFTKDMQRRYTFANKLVCDLFGCPPDEIVG